MALAIVQSPVMRTYILEKHGLNAALDRRASMRRSHERFQLCDAAYCALRFLAYFGRFIHRLFFAIIKGCLNQGCSFHRPKNYQNLTSELRGAVRRPT